MKAKRIMFSAEMAQAIEDGRKSVTRRMVKPQPEYHKMCHPIEQVERWGFIQRIKISENPPRYECFAKFAAPHKVGDLLAVCEPWRVSNEYDKPNGSEHIPDEATVEYNGQHEKGYKIGGPRPLPDLQRGRQRLARFMPMRFVRNFLRVTAVRVERLQDITEEDAVMEGVGCDCPIGYIPAYQKAPHVYCFANLIDSLHGAGTWESNPWVWVIDFERVEMVNPFNKSVPQVGLRDYGAIDWKNPITKKTYEVGIRAELGKNGWLYTAFLQDGKEQVELHPDTPDFRQCLADLNEYLRGEILKGGAK